MNQLGHPSNTCGLAFVGFSRVIDFSKMAFKNVLDYCMFQAMVETDMFRWRSNLEQRLDELHDERAAIVFQGKSSIKDDAQRHQAWTESLTGSNMSEEALADLTHMLSVRGVLPRPGYKDKPVRGVANKAGTMWSVVVRSPRSDFDELMHSTFCQKNGIHFGGQGTELFTWIRFSPPVR